MLSLPRSRGFELAKQLLRLGMLVPVALPPPGSEAASGALLPIATAKADICASTCPLYLSFPKIISGRIGDAALPRWE
jgi:hypothetical protein